MLTRQTIADWHFKSVSRNEDEYARELAKMFTAQGQSAAKRLRDLQPGKAPQQQAAALVELIFDPSEWDQQLFDVSFKSLFITMAEGAANELMAHDIAFKMLEHRADKTTQAQQFVDLYNLEVPPGVDLEMPAWFLNAAKASLAETFAQDYWQAINVTTRDDMQRTLERGFEDGLSIRQLAYEIEDRHGPEYGRVRALNVARTETVNMANEGHVVGMEHIEEELGFQVGKEWLSVLGSTTRETHAELDGVEVAGARGLFQLGGVLVPHPGHYNLPASERCNCQCVAPGQGISGNVLAASRMLYEGWLVELVLESGCRLHVTPNHPVLTARGIVVAECIQEGDDLFRIIEHELSGSVDYVQNEPPMIEDVFESVCSLSPGIERTRRVATQFNGDAAGAVGEVEVVRIDHILPRIGAANDTGCNILGFTSVASDVSRANERTRRIDSVSHALRCGVAANGNAAFFQPPSDRRTGRVVPLGDFLFADAAAVQLYNLATRQVLSDGRWPSSGVESSVPDSHVVCESNSNGRVVDAEFLSDRGYGPPAVVHSCKRAIVRKVRAASTFDDFALRLDPHEASNPGADGSSVDTVEPSDVGKRSKFNVLLGENFIGRQDSSVVCDAVRSVGRVWFRGHVYDLQTAEEWYAVNGIAVHNCTIVSGLVAEASSVTAPA